jgi:hypothetical protein
MTQQILSLLPPGGFSNLVGHYVAALDVGMAYIRDAANAAEDAGAACRALRAVGDLESRWVHEAVGAVPTPPAPETDDDVEPWLGWLEAVRTVSIMVLRPLQDRDLERLVRLAGEDGPARTLKRVLAELLFLQGQAAGGISES